MPTQHDFRAAAVSLRELAVGARRSAVSVGDLETDIGMSGGTATGIVTAAMNAAFLNATAVSTSADTAADECERRAQRCAEYTDEMRRWRESLANWQRRWISSLGALAIESDAPMPGPQPEQPVRWPAWVEEG